MSALISAEAMIIMKGWRESDEKERAEWPKQDAQPRARLCNAPQYEPTFQ